MEIKNVFALIVSSILVISIIVAITGCQNREYVQDNQSIGFHKEDNCTIEQTEKGFYDYKIISSSKYTNYMENTITGSAEIRLMNNDSGTANYTVVISLTLKNGTIKHMNQTKELLPGITERFIFNTDIDTESEDELGFEAKIIPQLKQINMKIC